MPPSPLPRLRPLVSVPLTADSESDVALFDPLRLDPEISGPIAVLGREEWRIASGLADAVEPEGDHELPFELIQRLDELGLLDNDAYRLRFGAGFEEFRRQSDRPATGAGVEYSPDRFDLRVTIGGMVADDWDMPPVSSARAVLAPGCSLRAGAPLYSRSFASVRHTRDRLRRVVLLGNLEAALDPILIPLAKPFATPLGSVPVDGEALAAIGALPGPSQLAHLGTRVLERAALFCRVLFPNTPIVPLLVSAPRPGENLLAHSSLESAAEQLTQLEALEGLTLYVLCTDLYHAGAGDPNASASPKPGIVLAGGSGQAIREDDRRCLDALTRLDAEDYARAVDEAEDPVRSALGRAPYLLMRALTAAGESKLAGSTLGYLQVPVPGRLATAASVVWH